MKKIVKALGVVATLLVIVAAIPTFIPDEEYLPGVVEWLEYNHATENVADDLNRFNAVVGFGVAADKDMVAEGARLIAEANAAIEASYKNKDTPPGIYWNDPSLTINNQLSDQLSEAFDDDPAQWISDNRDKYNELLASHRVLLDRYGVLMNMDQYSYSLKLDINAPYISYGDLMAVQQLHNLSIIDEFIRSNQQVAIRRIQQSISFSRLMMAQSVMLLDKMVATRMLENDLKTYSLLLDHSPVDIVVLNISSLQKEEMDFLKVIRGEFSYLSTSLYPENIYGFAADVDEAILIEDYIMRYYFKRKRMENNAYLNLWRPFLELQQMSFSDRQKKELAIFNEGMSWWEIYIDPPGYFLSAVATPAFTTYIAKVDHAAAMITLLNLKVSIYARDIKADDIDNMLSLLDPEVSAGYAGAKFIWDAEAEELSYEIPGYSDESIPSVKLTL